MASAIKNISLDNDSVIYEHIIPRSVRQKWIRRASIDHLDLEVTSPRGRARSKENVFEEEVKPKKIESENAENDFGDSIVSHDVQDLVKNENILDGNDIGLITPEEEKAVFNAWGVKLRRVGKNNEIKIRPGSFHESNLIKIDPPAAKQVSPSLQKPSKDELIASSPSTINNKVEIVKLRENSRRPRPKSMPAMTQEMESDYKNILENSNTSKPKPKAYISPHAKVPWKRFMNAANDLIVEKEKVTDNEPHQKQNDNNIEKDCGVKENRQVEKIDDDTKKEMVENRFDEKSKANDQRMENQFDVAQKQNINDDKICSESDNKDSGSTPVLLSIFERMKSFENVDKHKRGQVTDSRIKKCEPSTEDNKISKVNNDSLQGIKKIAVIPKSAENVTIKKNLPESEKSRNKHEESLKENPATVVPFVTKQNGFEEENYEISFVTNESQNIADIKTDLPSSNLKMKEELNNQGTKLGSISDSSNKNSTSGNSHKMLLDIFQSEPVSKEETNQENADKEALLLKEKEDYEKNEDEEKSDNSTIDKSIVFTALKTYEKKINKLVIQTGEQREKQLKSRQKKISNSKKEGNENVGDIESKSTQQQLQNGSNLVKKKHVSEDKQAKDNEFLHGEAKEKKDNGNSVKSVVHNGGHVTAESNIPVKEMAKSKSVIPVTNIDDLKLLPKESGQNIPVTNLDEPSLPSTNGIVLPSSLKRENKQTNKSGSKIVITPKKKPGKYDADRRALVAPKVFFEHPVTGLKSSLSPKGKKKEKVIYIFCEHFIGIRCIIPIYEMIYKTDKTKVN